MDPPAWTSLSDPELLEQKIASLGLRIDASEIAPWVTKLYEELGAKGLVFHPPCFVADEWFCPIGIPAIGIPFFLLHERLARLERKIIFEVEGETEAWFMRLMRHEAGHAYSYAYNLYKKKKWQAHFGLASTEEIDTYQPRPYSHSYVIHLDDWYAQSHPDEDFAETFAVWLTPGLDWRERYRGWKALAKLEYLDELMRSLAGQPPVNQPRALPAKLAGLNQKLKTYYARKRKLYEEDFPDFFDRDLRRLFVPGPKAPGLEAASRHLRRHRRQIMESVAQWTACKKFTVNELLKDLIRRCDELDMFVKTDDHNAQLHIAAFVTSLVMNYLFTGKFKRSK